jgi:hypothetical protein
MMRFRVEMANGVAYGRPRAVYFFLVLCTVALSSRVASAFPLFACYIMRLLGTELMLCGEHLSCETMPI